MTDAKLDKLTKFIISNPTARRDYYTNPLSVLERMIPESEGAWAELRAELGGRAEDAITEDPDLVSERNEHFEAYKPARFIAHNPRLRTRYFENPGKVLASAIPRRGLLERIWPAVPERVRKLRDELGEKVEAVVSNDPRLISDRESAVETNVFLSDALRNPKRTFKAIFWLSIVAFVIGVLFLTGGIAAAFLGEVTTQKAVLGGASGGGGAVMILGTVFAMSRDSIRTANRENAQIRLALTGFATQMAHLRAVPIEGSTDVHERNKEVREAMSEAARTIVEYVEPREGEPTAVGGAHSHPGQT